MLFYLHDNIIDIDYVNNVSASHALENILAAGVDGNHLITSNLRTLKALYNLPSISARSRAYLQKQINGFAEYGAVTKLIDVSCIIEGSLVDPYRDNNMNWHIPLLQFIRMDTVVQTTLLAENITDSKLYAHAAEHYKLRNKLSSLRISITNQGGGGSTTVDEVRRRLSRPGGFCICILDSDKYCPTSSYGNTSQSCVSIISGEEWWFDLLVTQKRELENELPQKFIESALKSNSELSATLDKYVKLTEILETVNESVGHYIDLKDGVSLKWILQLPEYSRDYWLSSIDNLVQNGECKSKCIASNLCINSGLGVGCKSDLVIDGVASSLSSIVLSWVDNQNPTNISKLLCDDKDANWISLGKKVFQLGW